MNIFYTDKRVVTFAVVESDIGFFRVYPDGTVTKFFDVTDQYHAYFDDQEGYAEVRDAGLRALAN